MEEELNKSFVDILSNVMNKKDIEIVPFPNGEKVTSIMSKLDKWVEKTILSNSKTVMVRGETYPYKNYSHIDELIRKHGKDYAKYLVSICPHKDRLDEFDDVDIDSMIDSIAFVVFKRKIDPKSIINIPTYKSLWDKISDNGHV